MEIEESDLHQIEVLRNENERLRKELEDLDKERLQWLKGVKSDPIGEIYQNIIETVDEGIWVSDENFRTIFVNQRLAEMLGYTRKELLGRIVFDFMDPEAVTLEKEYAERRRKGFKDHYEQKYIRKDGSILWTSFTASPILDQYGTFVSHLGLLTDITKRKSAETALQESEERYRQLVESANSCIIRLDLNGNFTFVNEFTLKLFGYAREEMIGKGIMMIIPETESTGRNLSLLIPEILHNLKQYPQFENENIKKNGERIWISWTNRIIVRENGDQEILTIGVDITERKRIEEEATARAAILDLERELFAGIFDNIPVMITIYDPDLNHFRFNNKFHEVTGWTEEDAPWKTLLKRFILILLTGKK